MLRSYLLVGIQFGLIGFLAWHGGIWGDSMLTHMLVVAGILIGLSAVFTMRFRFSVLPEVRAGQTLYTGGPYAFVRHPMYTAVLLVTLGWVLNRPDVVSFMLWTALAVDLLLKLHYEERALSERFSDYAAYMVRTRRLIPWVY